MMTLRRTKSEMAPHGRAGGMNTLGRVRSNHSNIWSIYSKNSILRDEDIDEAASRFSTPLARSVYSMRRSKSVDASPYSVHSVRSVFERAQDNYRTIIGSELPLSKVNCIWKALCEFVEEALKTDRTAVLPKLGYFTTVKTNLKGHVHKKPVLIIDGSFLQMHALRGKDYGVAAGQKSRVDYASVANKSKVNRFIVQEVLTEIWKSFEKMIMTKKNAELPFFQIGKLQVASGEIRMKFYEDFINTLNRSLIRSRSTSSLVGGGRLFSGGRLSPSSSVITKMTSRSKCYRPSFEFSSVLPFEIEAKQTATLPQARRSQSWHSQVSHRTRDTMSLLSAPRSTVHTARSCCSQHILPNAHGDGCLCFVCENRLRSTVLKDVHGQIVEGRRQEETMKGRLVRPTSKVKAGECSQRLAYNTSRELQMEAARYNDQLALNHTGTQAKTSVGSQPDNDLIFSRASSKCEKQKRGAQHSADIRKPSQFEQAKKQCQSRANELCAKEKSDQLIELLYQERMRNMRDKRNMQNPCRQDLGKQLREREVHERESKNKCKSEPNFNSALLRNTPLRQDLSSLSNKQAQRGRFKAQADYQKLQMADKKRRQAEEEEENDAYFRELLANTNRAIECEKVKALQKRQRIREEKSHDLATRKTQLTGDRSDTRFARRGPC